MKAILTSVVNVFLISSVLMTSSVNAAISLDRTRIVFDGGDKSQTLSVSNENKSLPYLAQGWIEDINGKKITAPLVVLPPVQRIEASAKSQLKIQQLPGSAALPNDRETLFYFNLREIPPRADKANTLQIALQTKIKLFYRPAAIKQEAKNENWAEKVTLKTVNGEYIINNPTPFYMTFVDVAQKVHGTPLKDFKPVMVEPKSSKPLGVGIKEIGNTPDLVFINDYGARPELSFSCNGNSCIAKQMKAEH